MIRKAPLLFALLLGTASAQADPGLTRPQLEALKTVAQKIKSCSTYSLNYGRNHPYEEGCVRRLAESASGLFAAFLPGERGLVRDIESVKRCPTYSLDYGRNHPYEEVCVDRLVEAVLADLDDLIAALPAPAPAQP